MKNLTRMEETGERLRAWTKSKYDRYTHAAKAMGITPQKLDTYLKGTVEPKHQFWNRVAELGGDVEFIKNGILSTPEITQVAVVTQNEISLPLLLQVLQEISRSNALMADILSRLDADDLKKKSNNNYITDMPVGQNLNLFNNGILQ